MHSAKEIGDLAKAERQIAEGRKRVRQQAQLVDDLRRNGHNAAEAEEQLGAAKDGLEALRQHQRNVISALAETD